MARSGSQKLKMLYLLKYLMEYSDEQHPVTLKQIAGELETHDISVERKTLYSDLEALRCFGADIVAANGGRSGYYIASREFELPELKLLVDSVQSSQFITQKKTLALIRKIESLASRYDAGKLHRQMYVYNRVKSMNESVYYIIDGISDAIAADRMIKFHYFDYTVGKQRSFRKQGAYYMVSPYALLRGSDKYYMLAWDHENRQLRHYRVDKMADVTTCDSRREGKESFDAIDIAEYTRKLFNMYNGESKSVCLRFDNRLVSAVIDRFGTDIIVIPEDGEHFTVTLEIVESPQFYAWLLGFGTSAEIVRPESIRENYRRQLEEVAGLYRDVPVET